MAMTELEQIRLYLRDQGAKPRFSDEDIAQLFEMQGSIAGAVALGWLLVAAEMGEATVSASIGNTSESYGQPTERYKVAMAMHQYWKSKDPEAFASPRWMEIVPDWRGGTGSLVSGLIHHQEFLLDYYLTGDTSRLGF